MRKEHDFLILEPSDPYLELLIPDQNQSFIQNIVGEIQLEYDALFHGCSDRPEGELDMTEPKAREMLNPFPTLLKGSHETFLIFQARAYTNILGFPDPYKSEALKNINTGKTPSSALFQARISIAIDQLPQPVKTLAQNALSTGSPPDLALALARAQVQIENTSGDLREFAQALLNQGINSLQAFKITLYEKVICRWPEEIRRKCRVKEPEETLRNLLAYDVIVNLRNNMHKTIALILMQSGRCPIDVLDCLDGQFSTRYMIEELAINTRE